MSEHDNKNAPIHSFRDGGVNIKLWEQEHQGKNYVNASVSKVYKDRKSGEWRESRSFNDTDLLRLQNLIPQAREAIREHQQQRHQEQTQEHDMAAERDAVMQKATRSPEPEQERIQEYEASQTKDRTR